RRVVEGVTVQRRLRRLADEVLQPLAGRREAAEEEGVDRAVTAGELSRMQVPTLVEPVDERVAGVVGVKTPGRVHRARGLPLLVLAERLALVGRDRHGGGGAVGQE